MTSPTPLAVLYALALVLLLAASPGRSQAQARAGSPSPGQAPVFVDQLGGRVDAWRQVLPVLSSSADDAARRLVAGGRLLVSGPQQSFVNEALGRAGGLMLVQEYRSDTPLAAGDTVLAACTAGLPADWAGLKRKAREAGALVILFADGREPPKQPGEVQWLPGSTSGWPQDARAGLGSISNIVGLWAWTGELVAACVRHGKMPCIYESYGMPGGRERDDALQQAPFHAVTRVRARDIRGLGARYLDGVSDALRRMRAVDFRAFPQAADLLAAARRRGGKALVVAVSHMFPAEMQSDATPAWLVPADEAARPGEGDAVLYLGYQAFPWKQLPTIAPDGGACVVTSARASLPEFARDPRRVYIDPCWPIEDGSMHIAGYDVKALPLSGVMQGAVYWQLVDMAKSGS